MKNEQMKSLATQFCIAAITAYAAYFFSVREARKSRKETRIETIYQLFAHEAAKLKNSCPFDSTSTIFSEAQHGFEIMFDSKSLQITDKHVVEKLLKVKSCMKYDLTPKNGCGSCNSDLNNLIVELNRI